MTTSSLLPSQSKPFGHGKGLKGVPVGLSSASHLGEMFTWRSRPRSLLHQSSPRAPKLLSFVWMRICFPQPTFAPSVVTLTSPALLPPAQIDCPKASVESPALLATKVKLDYEKHVKSLFLPHDEIKDRSAFMSCAIVQCHHDLTTEKHHQQTNCSCISIQKRLGQ